MTTQENRKAVEQVCNALVELAYEVDESPAFLGAVLTLAMGRLLALLDDDLAARAIAMHAEKAMGFRAVLRRRPN